MKKYHFMEGPKDVHLIRKCGFRDTGCRRVNKTALFYDNTRINKTDPAATEIDVGQCIGQCNGELPGIHIRTD